MENRMDFWKEMRSLNQDVNPRHRLRRLCPPNNCQPVSQLFRSLCLVRSTMTVLAYRIDCSLSTARPLTPNRCPPGEFARGMTVFAEE
jgi:hypothetical protein